jgi:hypothetical protein
MTIIHLFDQPLTVTRPYEAYFGCLTVPGAVARMAEKQSVVLDWATPRKTVLELIEATYPGIARKNVHVWTLRGKSREKRLSRLWKQWEELGAHVVDDGWVAPTGIPVFCDSGTYAPTHLVKSWRDAHGQEHVFLVDGYAATAEAMQAGSLSEVLDVDATMTVLSPTFDLPYDQEYELMRLAAEGDDFEARVADVVGREAATPELVKHYRESIEDALRSNVPLRKRALRPVDLVPSKQWSVLACTGAICDDPYTGMKGVEDLGGGRYRVTTMLATHAARSQITFTLRLMESPEESKLIFSPLLVRFMSGADWTSRPVKISDAGRIRNELQTLISQALEYEGDRIRVHFDRIDEKVLPRESQDVIRRVLHWYKQHHPVWFEWLEL